ncbi:hypothetical protein B1R70_15295, partial [Salmonella enterica subsp. enterica serovar Weltevreden]
RGCNPTSSKFIHTWLRFGEIMRGSLRAAPATLRTVFVKHLPADSGILGLRFHKHQADHDRPYPSPSPPAQIRCAARYV